MMPVFIPTKGRAGSAKCIEQFIWETEAEGVTAIVEPHEAEDYKKNYPGLNFLVLPQSNQGIAYVRNFLLEYAKKNGIPFFWQLDDDIRMMGKVVNGKVEKLSFRKAIEGASVELLNVHGLAIGAMEYQQFAWSAKNAFAFNSYCDTCVFINTDFVKHLKYRPNLKEDRDFVLQVLSMGFRSARTTRFCFGAPKNGSNKGGLHDEYKAGLERQWSENMVKTWPGVCSLHTKKDGRPDVKVNWKLFK